MAPPDIPELRYLERLLQENGDTQDDKDTIYRMESLLVQVTNDYVQQNVEIEELQKTDTELVVKIKNLGIENARVGNISEKRPPDEGAVQPEFNPKEILQQMELLFHEEVTNHNKETDDAQIADFTSVLNGENEETELIARATEKAIEAHKHAEHAHQTHLHVLEDDLAAVDKRMEATNQNILWNQRVLEKMIEHITAKTESDLAVKTENTNLQAAIDAKKEEIDEKTKEFDKRKGELSSAIDDARKSNNQLRHDHVQQQMAIEKQNEIFVLQPKQKSNLQEGVEYLSQLSIACEELEIAKDVLSQKQSLHIAKQTHFDQRKKSCNELKEKLALLQMDEAASRTPSEKLEMTRKRVYELQFEISKKANEIAQRKVAATARETAQRAEISFLKDKGKDLDKEQVELEENQAAQLKEMKEKVKAKRANYETAKGSYNVLHNECGVLKHQLQCIADNKAKKMAPPPPPSPQSRVSRDNNLSQDSEASDATVDGVKVRRFDKSLV